MCRCFHRNEIPGFSIAVALRSGSVETRSLILVFPVIFLQMQHLCVGPSSGPVQGQIISASLRTNSVMEDQIVPMELMNSHDVVSDVFFPISKN